MRHLSIVAIAAASAVTFTQIAWSADMPLKAPAIAPPPSYGWTGFYVGANIGGGWGSRDADISANDPAAQTFLDIVAVSGGNPPPASFDSSGGLGGVQLGYNWQFDRSWLVGVETDFDWSGIKGSGSTTAGPVRVANASYEERIKWFGTVRGRLGYLPTNNFLAFISGGFAYGRVGHTANYSLTNAPFGVLNLPFSVICLNLPNTCFAGSSNNTATGWTLGGGLEYAFWGNFRVKVEYLYVSLDAKSVTETALQTVGPNQTPASLNANFNRTNFNVARLGVNYRF